MNVKVYLKISVRANFRGVYKNMLIAVKAMTGYKPWNEVTTLTISEAISNAL